MAFFQRTTTSLPMGCFIHTNSSSSSFISSKPAFRSVLPRQTKTTPRSSHIVSAEGASTEKTPIGNPSKLPTSSNDIVDQAYASVKTSWEAGAKRQRVELVLPLIGATDLDDWPGGIRQQFKAATPMIERLLRQLKKLPGLEGPLSATLLDDADAVGAWVGDNLALVVFPTAETLNKVRKLAEERPNALFILVNPQWTTEGQVISDFGILPWVKKAAMEFIETFKDGYCIRNLRINGDYVQWLFVHPAGWQVNVLQGPNQSQVILQGKERPSYKEVEAKLRSLPWTMSSKGLFQRIQAEAEFNRKSVQQGAPPRE
ncbi:hypothetical protein Ndes2526A_g08718 [Nannochloris sp. 'desiccata']